MEYLAAIIIAVIGLPAGVASLLRELRLRRRKPPRQKLPKPPAE